VKVYSNQQVLTALRDQRACSVRIWRIIHNSRRIQKRYSSHRISTGSARSYGWAVAVRRGARQLHQILARGCGRCALDWKQGGCGRRFL